MAFSSRSPASEFTPLLETLTEFHPTVRLRHEFDGSTTIHVFDQGKGSRIDAWDGPELRHSILWHSVIFLIHPDDVQVLTDNPDHVNWVLYYRDGHVGVFRGARYVGDEHDSPVALDRDFLALQ